MPTISVRVDKAAFDKARELMANVPDKRFGPGEVREVSDRHLTDMAFSWLIGRMQGDVFTKAEVDATAMRTVVDVMARTLGVKVNGMAVDGAFTLTWDAPDGKKSEVTVNVEA